MSTSHNPPTMDDRAIPLPTFEELADAADAARPPRLHWLMTGVPGDQRYAHMQFVGEKTYGSVPELTDCGKQTTVAWAIADSTQVPAALPDDICQACLDANVAAGRVNRDDDA